MWWQRGGRDEAFFFWLWCFSFLPPTSGSVMAPSASCQPKMDIMLRAASCRHTRCWNCGQAMMMRHEESWEATYLLIAQVDVPEPKNKKEKKENASKGLVK
jgi:hypothetical protein